MAMSGERAEAHFLTIPEAAEYLGLSVLTVRGYIKDGRLSALRLGPKLIRVSRESLDALLTPYEAGADR